MAKKRLWRGLIWQGPLWLGLLLFSAGALLPFLYMATTALTPHSYAMPYPPVLIPNRFDTGSFALAWRSNHFGLYFLNSLVVSVTATALILFVSTLSAFGFARMPFPGRGFFFNLFLFSMMVPPITNLAAQFTLMRNLGLVDRFWGLALIYTGTGVAANTYFLRSFFLGFPRELEEAMTVDGGGPFMIYSRLILPLSKPAVATFGILAFSNVWDEFLLALTLIKSPENRTLPIAIKLFEGQHVSDWSLIFAASLIAVTPILVLYVAFQKYLIKGGALDGTLKE
jgi:multiple sugar transport system permease protein